MSTTGLLESLTGQLFVDDSGKIWLMTSHKIVDELTAMVKLTVKPTGLPHNMHNEICFYKLVFLNSEFGKYTNTMVFYDNLDDVAIVLETIDQETGLTLLCQQRLQL